eukprot:11685319-Heterocapsa_arctica.AAC.1
MGPLQATYLALNLPPGNFTSPNRSRTASPVVVAPRRPPSPVLGMTARMMPPPMSHLRPPPPVPLTRPYVRPEFVPPRPWCLQHPTACFPHDCQA